jgi:type VI secretion system protein ImpL
MMKLLLLILKKPFSILLIGLILLALLIWFLGPMAGLGGRGPRVLLLAIVALVVILFYVMQRLTAVRGSDRLEKSLVSGGGAPMVVRPDKRQEIEQLKERMAEAIASLKTSKLGRGRSGKAALYALPWYIIIGPPGSGKSTALAKSELNFPYLDPSGRGIRGVGGTRNCDWWFTSDSILLDTAGRYTTEAEDREEWIAFLDLLRKNRPHKPVNGVIVAVAISDLMNASDEQLVQHAKTIRARIDELIERLGITFPVYLLFTKCDLLEGFVEMFDDLRKNERAQVWGTTFAVGGDGRAPRALFNTEFEKLANALDQRRLARLAAEGKTEVRNKIYLFPLEYRSSQDSLAEFVSLLFQPNPYQEQPLFRGFYFSSGTQEGTPLDLVLSKLMDTFHLPAPFVAEVAERGETKSYFIHDLFTEIIFPDQHLAGLSLKGARKQTALRRYLLMGAAALSVLWLIGGVISFFGNRSLIGQTRRIAAEAAHIDWKEGTVPSNLQKLEGLRSHLEKLENQAEKGAPLRLRWGLYHGKQTARFGRKVYFDRFGAFFIRQAGDDLAALLRDPQSHFVTTYEQYYPALRTYLMLTRPDRADSLALSQSFMDLLRRKVPDTDLSGVESLLSPQLEYFWKHRAEVPGLTSDENVLRSARLFLSKQLTPRRYYDGLILSLNIEIPAFTLADAAGTQTILRSVYRVPGPFTPAGWDKVQGVMGFQGLPRMADWVLEDVFGTAQLASMMAGMQDSLRRYYVADYGYHWANFLGDVVMQRTCDPQEAGRAFALLASPESPQLKVLRAASTSTQLAGTDVATFPELEKKFTAVRAFVATPKGEGAQSPSADYVKNLGAIKDAIAGVAGAGGPPAETALRNAITEANKWVDNYLYNYGPESGEVLRSILKQPMIALCVKGVRAGEQAQQRFRAEIVTAFRPLAGKYPFNPRGEDAPLIDIAAFFHPATGIFWKFFEQELAPCLTRTGELTGAKDCDWISEDMRNAVRQANAISQAIFAGGGPSPEVPFDLYPNTPRVVGGSNPQVSEMNLSFGGQGFRYRMEMQEWRSFSWPGSGSGGASLRISSKAGSPEPLSYEGYWALFRLLDNANPEMETSTITQYTWTMEIPAGSGNRVEIGYRLRARTSSHPFRRGFFSSFRVPG